MTVSKKMLSLILSAAFGIILLAIVGLTQMSRLGQPDEVAAAVAFLAGEEASFVTGETLGVSGGLGMV